jgi:hypothetical protein
MGREMIESQFNIKRESRDFPKVQVCTGKIKIPIQFGIEGGLDLVIGVIKIAQGCSRRVKFRRWNAQYNRCSVAHP